MRFLKRLMSKRNNAGFTLVEIVISVGLLGILLVGMTIFVGPVLQAAGDTKKDIRASILAETLDAYIGRSIMNARNVAVFSNIAVTGAQKDTDLQTVYKSNELKTFKDFFNSGDKSSYEVRCIGINWLMDPRTQEYKYMLTLGKVKDGISGGYYRIDQSNHVFEDCFYEGLYPEITLEQGYSADDGSKASALKLTINVYSDGAMKSMAMAGEGYSQLLNVKNAIITEGGTVDNYISFTEIAGEKGEHSDTYIFYITRKTF